MAARLAQNQRGIGDRSFVLGSVSCLFPLQGRCFGKPTSPLKRALWNGEHIKQAPTLCPPLTVHPLAYHRHPLNPLPTDHQLCKADIELLGIWDGTRELQILQWVAVPEVDLGEVTASKAAKEAQAMRTPLAEGHGHCRLGWSAGWHLRSSLAQSR